MKLWEVHSDEKRFVKAQVTHDDNLLIGVITNAAFNADALLLVLPAPILVQVQAAVDVQVRQGRHAPYSFSHQPQECWQGTSQLQFLGSWLPELGPQGREVCAPLVGTMTVTVARWLALRLHHQSAAARARQYGHPP